MKPQALLDVVKTRISACDGNPTERRFYEELKLALERLIKYENT